MKLFNSLKRIYLFIPKDQRLYRLSLEMYK